MKPAAYAKRLERLASDLELTARRVARRLRWMAARGTSLYSPKAIRLRDRDLSLRRAAWQLREEAHWHRGLEVDP